MRKIFIVCFLFVLLSCSDQGDKIKEFRLQTLDGKIISDKTLKGKITVVNIWATWCGTCLNEIPELNELVKKYEQDTTVLFLALSDESPEKVQSSMVKRSFNFIQIPEASDLTGELRSGFVKVYPQHFVIGKDLKIKFKHTDELDNVVSVLSNEIEKAR